MKKIKPLLLTALLVCGAGLPAWGAAVPEVGLEWLSGNDDYTYHEAGLTNAMAYSNASDNNPNLSGMLLNVKYPTNEWLTYCLEYGGGSGDPDDFTLASLKADYAWFLGKKVTYGPYLGYLYWKGDVLKSNGPTLGFQFQYTFNSRLTLDGGFGYTPSVESQFGYSSSSDIALYDGQLRLAYQINQRFSLDLGYRMYQYSGQYYHYTDDANYFDSDLDGKIQMFTVGCAYRFLRKEVPAGTEKAETQTGETAPNTIQSRAQTAASEPPASQPATSTQTASTSTNTTTSTTDTSTPASPTTTATAPSVTSAPANATTTAVAVTNTPVINVPTANTPSVETPKVKQPESQAAPARFLTPLFFAFDRYTIRPDQQAALDQDVAYLKANAGGYILVGGHADARGPQEYNRKLSKKRALAVVDYLVKQGIDPARITVYAYGEAHPEAKGHPDVWESDRWVDIVVTVAAPTIKQGIR